MSTTKEVPVSTVDAGVDATRQIVSGVRTSFAELDGYPVSDLTEDVELAEVIGRLKALTAVLLSIVDN